MPPDPFLKLAAAARAYTAVVAERTAAPSVPVAPTDIWGWAGFLAGWPAWRPHLLERRLTGAIADTRLAARLRAAADARRWLPGGRGVTDLLTAAADRLDLLKPVVADWLDRAAVAAASVEVAVAEIPASCPAARLARAGRPLGDAWPPPPPDGVTSEIDHLAENAQADRNGLLFQAIISEYFPYLPIDPVGALVPLFDQPPSAAVARLALRAALERSPTLQPLIDPRTLCPMPGHLPADAEVRYCVHTSPPRTIVRVDRFASPPERAAVTVSLGPAPPDWAAALTSAEDGSGLPAGRPKEVMLAARQTASAAFLKGLDRPTFHNPKEPIDISADGDWFHTLAADQSGMVWLMAFRAWFDLDCYPAPGSNPVWPDGLSLAQPGTTFRPDPRPPGSVIEVGRYAPDPASARFVVSLGPNPSHAATTVGSLWPLVAERTNADRIAPLVDAVVRCQPVTGDQLIPALDVMSDVLPADTLKFVAAIREAATAGGYELLPVWWDGEDGRVWPTDPGRGVAAVPVFRRAEPAGSVLRVRGYGLAQHGKVLRTAQVVVSAGPPPVRLEELEACAASAPGSGGQAVRQALTALRVGGMSGRLNEAVAELFAVFWHDAADQWTKADPLAANEFAANLRELIDGMTNINVFEPVRVFDHPAGWVEVPPGRRLTSGTVTRLVSPGLVGSDGRLWLAARVDAE